MLTKPGIIFGNLVTAMAGFCLAAQKGGMEASLFFAALGGLSLIIASACVCNNYIDRDIDSMMKRTKNRPSVIGNIPLVNGVVFALLLLLGGSVLLAKCTTTLALLTALFGFFVYVVIYGVAKRKTHHATLIGSVAGAVPPVVGYTAVTGSFDMTALLLFSIVLFWQLPHFFAIAIYRLEEYKAANVPVLPAVSGVAVTKTYMLFAIFAFIAATLSLWAFRGMGPVYLITSCLLGVTWIMLSVSNKEMWARKMFFFSLAVIMLLCLAIAFE